MTDKPATPQERLAGVESAISLAATEAKRDRDTITLIAVSKTFGPEAIQPVIDLGQRDFGENRVQEAMGKWPQLREANDGLTLHLIGPLQTNKVRDAVRLFDVFHALDREKLARELAKEMDKQDRQLGLFVQVNTGEEPQKAGIKPSETTDFLKLYRDTYGLAIRGLMCIPPIEDVPGPHFALLERLAEDNGVAELSMGMSADYETAILFGASHIRVGSAIFGPRG